MPENRISASLSPAFGAQHISDGVGDYATIFDVQDGEAHL